MVILILFCGYMQSIVPMLLRSLCRLLSAFIWRPTAAMTTLLHESNLLPHNLNLERFIEEDLLDSENYLFHFIINMLRCLWWSWKQFLSPEMPGGPLVFSNYWIAVTASDWTDEWFFISPIIDWRFKSIGLFCTVVLTFSEIRWWFAHCVCLNWGFSDGSFQSLVVNSACI